MFSIFKLFNSIELNNYEKDYLHEILNEAQKHAEFAWLDQLNLKNLNIKECPEMMYTEIMGAFTPLSPGTIYLQRVMQPSTELHPLWLEFIFPTVIHELRHMLQFKKSPLLYCLCAIPGIRNLTLERDAEKQELLAEDFILEYCLNKDYIRKEKVKS